jgi:hypothetical protein
MPACLGCVWMRTGTQTENWGGDAIRFSALGQTGLDTEMHERNEMSN